MTKRNQNRLFTAILVAVLLFVIVATSACGSDGNYNQVEIDKINACIGSGGHPITGSGSYGIYYVACDTNVPVTP